jgi:hypothetical protein
MYNFKVNYWDSDKSTKVQFSPLDKLSEDAQASSCMAFILDNKKATNDKA